MMIMKLLNRVKRVFSIKSNNLLKKMEDSIEVLEYELNKSKESINQLSERISKIKAQQNTVLDDKEKAESYIDQLKRVLDRAVEKDDSELGNETIELIEKNEEKVKIFDQNITYYDEVVSKLNNQYSSLKVKYDEKFRKLETLRIKNDFAKSMESVNKELKKNYSDGEIDFGEFDKIEKEIQEKIYYENDRNEVMSAKDSFESRASELTNVDKFEEYKKKLQSGDE